MQYSKSNLIKRICKGEALEYLFFWGHQPSSDGKVTASCLCQWWQCEFTDGDLQYVSAEQFMMAAKARCFHDEFMLHKILAEKNPAVIKKLGRQVRNFSPVLWDEKKRAVVIEGNFLKFSQNLALRDFLLATGDTILVEASPYDCIWGIGLRKDDPDSRAPEKWHGENLLGFALMEVRDLLRTNTVSALSPAEQIVAELAKIGIYSGNPDFTEQLRQGNWDDEQFELLLQTLKKNKATFDRLPDAVKILLEFYIELPNQMLGYIERSTGEEQKQLYEKYFDLLSVMSETLSVEDVESTLIRWKCAAILRKREE